MSRRAALPACSITNKLIPKSDIAYAPQTGLYIDWKGERILGERLSSDLLPGTLFMMILKTLNAGELHGYAIAKRIKESSNGALVIEEGSLYPALNRMLVKGWVRAEWGVSETNRKARFYKLTPEGRKQLKKESEEFDLLMRSIQLVMKKA
jgi:transcriptional regulator